MKCRACKKKDLSIFVDLGMSPIANNLVRNQDSNYNDKRYPLKVFVCMNCSLLQLPNQFTELEIFKDDYIYLSSYSESWLEHCKRFVREITNDLKIVKGDLVIEIASNDGYLLQFFKDQNISVLGIEPTASSANRAIDKLIPTIKEFFGKELAQNLRKNGFNPKLVIANNVIAHVPNLIDFIEGLSVLAQDDTMITIEFPHSYNLIKYNQFDTIYHEHYSYLSLTALIPVFEKFSLFIVDIERIETHGGSLRLYLKKRPLGEKLSVINSIVALEQSLDPRNEMVKLDFIKKISRVKEELLKEIDAWKKQNYFVVAYGAAAKGNTLLNYCGVDYKSIKFVVDRNPIKQGKKLPGSRIPVYSEETLNKTSIDVVLILPWNISSELTSQLGWLRSKGTKFVRVIPTLEYI